MWMGKSIYEKEWLCRHTNWGREDEVEEKGSGVIKMPWRQQPTMKTTRLSPYEQ
jgi:hypothetical protein